MRQIITKTMIIFFVISMTSCASIIHGNIQTVAFSSQPKGAKVIIDGKEYGVTPTSAILKRKGRLKGEAAEKKAYNVVIDLDGYYPYEITLNRTVDGWFFGNVIFGGILGIIIDAASGSMYKLTSDQVIATLGRETSDNSIINENIIFAVSLDINPEWEKIGQLELK